MQVKLKLYASLGQFLPDGAARNISEIEVADGTTITEVLDRYNVPPKMCHLVLLNGHFQAPAIRPSVKLKAGDHLAVWPPVAGG
jgi:molybdopterin converting factor small subunit